jgi:tetratricopeptide (TPR) repeat protein
MSPNFYQKSEVLFKLGTIFAKTNQINEAINYFQNSIVASTFTIKRKIDTLLKIGLLYEVKTDYAAAQRSYEAALSLNEHNYRVYQHLAWCHFLKGNINMAIENLEKADRKLKGSTDTLYIQGRCMLELNKHREAHYYFHEAARKAPNEAIFWASLAYYYYQEGKYKETFNNIIKATALKPELFEIWYNLGILYEKCKQPEEALIAYDRVL